MKRGNILSFTPMVILPVAALAVCAVVSAFFDLTLFWIQAALCAVVIIIVARMFQKKEKHLFNSLSAMATILSASDRTVLKSFSIPVVMTADTGEVLWYNNSYRANVLEDNDITGKNISEIIGEDRNKYFGHNHEWVSYKRKEYRVLGADCGYAGNKIYYFIEDTKLKQTADEYALSHPNVMIIVIDNYEELTQNAKESEKSILFSKFDSMLEEYISNTNGFVTKLKSDRFIAVVEERDLNRMIENKFPLLEKARAIHDNETTPLTISIGVGRSSKSLAESEMLARQGIEMALGRGGDQAVLRSEDSYEFYGGVSKGYEKTTKVKSRMIGNALRELVNEADNVIVMGHRFADLDATGAAIALACAVREVGRNAFIAMDIEKTISEPLISHVMPNFTGLFVHPDVAMEQVNKNTLLIIVDTHIKSLLESEELYEKCKTVVIIDHHRKNVNFIDNAVIFYHEPYASSTCEMVTEILQYWASTPVVGKQQAEGLLAGIMLDTKNFIYKAGVRTFEACAYLRRRGAETSAVRKLFTSSLDAYQRKIRLVSQAITYKGCAIAQCDFYSDDLRVVAPQAADELLNIAGVGAAFVLYEIGDVVHISARSMGEINVQVIMEKLGGGGHLTMAGVQLTGTDMQSAYSRLLSAIDSVKTQ